jgi:UDP-N-acetyl-D-glucosamine dehydrogenase
MDHREFCALLTEGTPRVVVVGGGYVGLPLAIEAAANGCNVTVLDIDKAKVAAINAGRSYIDDVHGPTVESFVKGGKLRATADAYEAYVGAHAVLICVPTPLQPSREPDISLVCAALRPLNINLAGTHDPVLVVLESTVYPGFTRDEMRDRLGGSGGERTVYMAFSPERIDPASKTHRVGNTPKVVGGVDPASTEAACALYRRVITAGVVPVSSSSAAELVKLLENTYRAVNIALVNEFALVAKKLGIDIWEVVDAAATKPYGFQKFTPGPGVGGHCIGLDPPYLSWKMRALDLETRLLDTAIMVNRAMPRYVVGRLADLLNDYGLCLHGTRVLVLGVAYKPDVSDTRESPALDIIRELRARGALVNYHDPRVPSLAHEGFALESVALDRLADGYDAAIIVTNHSDFDYRALLAHVLHVLDTRGATRELIDRDELPCGTVVELL